MVNIQTVKKNAHPLLKVNDVTLIRCDFNIADGLQKVKGHFSLMKVLQTTKNFHLIEQ